MCNVYNPIRPIIFAGLSALTLSVSETSADAQAICRTVVNEYVTFIPCDVNPASGAVSGTSILAGSGGIASTGLALLDGGLTVNGGATVNGFLAANNGLGVTGQGTFGSIVSNGNTQTGSLAVTGNSQLNTLTVSGQTQLQGGANIAGPVNVNGLATFTNGAGQGSTTVGGGVLSVNGPAAGQAIVLDANADPVFTVNGGTTATATTIDNGVVTSGSSVNAPTVNAATVNTATANVGVANIGTANVNNLSVAPGGSIDAGGNRIQDVATPVLGTDAASKAYVDAGLAAVAQEDRKLQAGIAMAAAIPHTVVLPGERVAFDINWANYAGANGVGFDGAVRLGQIDFAEGPVSIQGNAGVAFAGDNSGGRAIAKAGLRFGW